MMRKKRRPTLQDALEFLRGGTYSIEQSDYVLWEERARELEELREAASALLKTHLSKTHNLVLVILTCHIILEFMLNKYIEFAATAQTDVSRERFSFAQKILLLHMFGFPPLPDVIPSLELLNQVRNQVAHTLDLDRDKIDLLIRINHATPMDGSKMDDRQRVKAIKVITAFLCGHMSGAIAALNVSRFHERGAFKDITIAEEAV